MNSLYSLCTTGNLYYFLLFSIIRLLIGCLNSTVMFSFGCYVARYTNSQCWAATVLPIWAGFVGGLYYFYFMLDRETRKKVFCIFAKKQWATTASGWQIRNSKRYPGNLLNCVTTCICPAEYMYKELCVTTCICPAEYMYKELFIPSRFFFWVIH